MSNPYTFLLVGEVRDLTFREVVKDEGDWAWYFDRIFLYYVFSKENIRDFEINNHCWGWKMLLWTQPGLTYLERAICLRKSKWSALQNLIRMGDWGSGDSGEVWLRVSPL